MPRSTSARLAVLLIIIPIALALRTAARADDRCVVTPTGIKCSFGGATTSTTVTTTKPPLRYLVITASGSGSCWYWSRYPPGLDSLDPANDQAIIFTRAARPRCVSARPPTTTINTGSIAWGVFRSWTLATPSPRLRPTVGITNLDSVLTAPRPTPLRHRETLPDRRVLEVEARVISVLVDWGDGTPTFAHDPPVAAGGGARHAYRLKTCTPTYRRNHPRGAACHPTLAAYRITVTHSWQGRYRTGGSWTVLGTIPRSTTRSYDVDEVYGVPVAP
ncbi:MAG: hypothetical protein WEA29_04660 [Acidimicrobiia bacterium]